MTMYFYYYSTTCSGSQVVILHVCVSLAGGMYSLFDGRMDKLVKETPATNQVFNFRDLIPS